MRLNTIDCKHWTRLGLGGTCSHADSGQATPSIAYCEKRCTVRDARDPLSPCEHCGGTWHTSEKCPIGNSTTPTIEKRRARAGGCCGRPYNS